MADANVPPQPAPRIQSVLFACSENAVRSPMAAALAEQRFGRLMHVASVGVRPGEPDPFMVEAMDEMGLDLSRHRPRTFEELDDACFDMIVTLSPEAHHRALEFTRTMAVSVVYWPTLDATGIEGSRAIMLQAYRSVRDALAARIRTTLMADAQPSADLPG